MNNCLKGSNIEIHKVSWDLLSARNADKKVVKVAMLSNISHEPSQVVSSNKRFDQTSGNTSPKDALHKHSDSESTSLPPPPYSPRTVDTTKLVPLAQTRPPQKFPGSAERFTAPLRPHRTGSASHDHRSGHQLPVTLTSQPFNSPSAPVPYGAPEVSPRVEYSGRDHRLQAVIPHREPNSLNLSRGAVAGGTPGTPRHFPESPTYNPSGPQCRVPGCSQPSCFVNCIQEQSDYCGNHLYTAVPQGFATSCERCKELPARHGSRYCGQSCRNADAGGLAATCQECRRPIIGDPNRRFCSLQCENAFRGSLSRR